MINGRYDCRGVVVSTPVVISNIKEYSGIGLAAGITRIENCSIKDVDFSGANLNGLILSNNYFENCLFEKTKCENWKMWNNTFNGCMFKQASLKKSTLGAVRGEQRNHYRQIIFERCNLIKTSNFSASYIGCLFDNCSLNDVDFQGSTFDDCKFKGIIEDVLFYNHAFKGEIFPLNEMKNVDFSEALLRHVEFRKLNMDSVLWPSDKNHIVIHDYKNQLSRIIAKLEPKSDLPSRRLTAILKMKLRWAGDGQLKGIISRDDLEEAVGVDLVEQFASLFK